MTSSGRKEEEERQASDVLPSELWTEILVRLPVRSLIILESVSKAFRPLIRNPSFTFLHFSRFHKFYSQSKHPDRYEIVLQRNVSDTGRDLSSLPPSRPTYRIPIDDWDYVLLHESESHTPTRSVQLRSRVLSRAAYSDVFIVGSVHGMLLLSTPTKAMVLFNPSIGGCVRIPESTSSHLGDTRFGFGYDPVSHDYKIVSIVYVQDQPPLETDQHRASPRALVEIYSFREPWWRQLDSDVLPRGWFLEACVFLNGCLHWIAGWDIDKDHSLSHDGILTHVVSFNLGTEIFSYRELPEFDVVDDDDDDHDLGEEMYRLIVLFRGSLAVVGLFENQISFWVMRDGNWTKECSVRPDAELPHYLIYEAPYIISAIFSEGSNKLMATLSDGIFSYNIETQKFTRPHRHDAIDVAHYAESLIWPFGQNGFPQLILAPAE